MNVIVMNVIVECDGETQRHEKSVLRKIHLGSDQHFTGDLHTNLHKDIPGKFHQNHRVRLVNVTYPSRIS